MRETTTVAAEDVRRFDDVLNASGLHAALEFLNGRTRHRYTGVYRFDPPLLRSVCLFDRENPSLTLGGDVPMCETYCSIVGETAAPFGTADAEADERLVRHPARGSTRAYWGVPLRRADGSALGSLCHFDVRPRLVPECECALMEHAAVRITAALPGSSS